MSGPQWFFPWADLVQQCCFVRTRYGSRPDTGLSPYPVPDRLPTLRPKRLAEFSAGQWCAQKAIGTITGLSLLPGRDADGVPIWPIGTIGSISHSHGWAMAACAQHDRCHAIGVDIELILDDQGADEIAPHVLTLAEMSAIPHTRRGYFITTAFSAKESLYKALYPKMRTFRGFHSAVFSRDPVTDALWLELCEDWSDEWKCGARFEVRTHQTQTHVMTCVYVPKRHLAHSLL